MIPQWLTALSIFMLLLGGLCSLIIVADELMGNRQKMWIMNVVWPVTALYGTVIALWAYFKYGRLATRRKTQQAEDQQASDQRKLPFPAMVGKGAAHCGAGCTLGDICAEWIMLAIPFSLFGHKLFGAWVIDYLCAYAFGIAFQYFTIVPMRHLSVGEGIWAAIKADTLSLTAWQVGMYGWAAVVVFLIFGHELDKTGPVFWFMMQIGMLCGFLTSYPLNWWLLRAGLKEKM